MNTKDIAAHYVFGVANKEIAKRDRTIAAQAAENERLKTVLKNALLNERQDACCMPLINPCHCWRCEARRALAGQDGG